MVLSLDYASYSVLVRNIPGLAGDTPKGGKTGLGITLGRDFGKWNFNAGYSTTLGLMAGVEYKL